MNVNLRLVLDLGDPKPDRTHQHIQVAGVLFFLAFVHLLMRYSYQTWTTTWVP